MNVEVEQQDPDLINKRSAIFKNLLITKFRLADKIGSKVVFSKATCSDLVERRILIDELMRDSPDAKVKYSLKKIRARTLRTKRFRGVMVQRNRAANKFSSSSYLIKDWMRWLLANKLFTRIFYLVVVWNMVAVVLDVEHGRSFDGSNFRKIKTGGRVRWNLAIAQNTLSLLLLFQLIAKWILDFRGYWKNFWNYIDFFVVVATTPLMGTFFGWYKIHFGETVLQACRTLIALKLIHELNAMKAVFELLALTVASMVYVVGFIVILTYLCSLIATSLFDTQLIPEQSIGGRRDINWEPAYSFSYGLGQSIITIFRLFTLDGWYKFYKSFIEVHEVYSSSIFIFTWVFLSAFLLGNLFPALLITNFQRLRGQLNEEIEHAEIIREMSKEIVELGDQIQGARNPLLHKYSTETTGTDDGVVLKATSYSKTSVHTSDVSQSFIDRLFAYPKMSLYSQQETSIRRQRTSAVKLGAPPSTLQHKRKTSPKFTRQLESILHMLPPETESYKPIWLFDTTPASTIGSHHETRLSHNALLTSDQLQHSLSKQSQTIYNLVSSTEALTSPRPSAKLSDSISSKQTIKTGEIRRVRSNMSWLAKVDDVVNQEDTKQQHSRPSTSVSRKKSGSKRKSNYKESQKLEKLSTIISYPIRMGESSLMSESDTHKTKNRSALTVGNIQYSKTKHTPASSNSTQSGASSAGKSRVISTEHGNWENMGKGSRASSQLDPTTRAKVDEESASVELEGKSSNETSAKPDDPDSTSRARENAYDNNFKTSREVSKSRTKWDQNNNARSKKSPEIEEDSTYKKKASEPEGSLGKRSTSMSSPAPQLSPSGLSTPTLERSLVPGKHTPMTLTIPNQLLVGENAALMRQFSSSSERQDMVEPSLAKMQSQVYRIRKQYSNVSKVSNALGQEKMVSDGSTLSNSTKIMSVLKVFRIFSTYGVRNKLRKLTRQHSDTADPVDVQINVISATPRGSINPDNNQFTDLLADHKLIDEEGNLLRRHALRSTSSDEIDMKLASKQSSGLGMLMMPGVKSKLNMMEAVMGKHGKSIKVMRTNLGQRGKVKGGENAFGKRRGSSRKSSLSSLGKAFANRKQHPERVMQRQYLMQEVKKILLDHEHKTTKWTETIKNCHSALRGLEIDTEWTDTVLLSYLHTLTELMENLTERASLVNLLSHCLIAITDDIQHDRALKLATYAPTWSLIHMVRSRVKEFEPLKKQSDGMSENRSIDTHSGTDIMTPPKSRPRYRPIGAKAGDSFDDIIFGPRKMSEEAFTLP